MTNLEDASSQPGDPTDVTFVRGNERLARMLAKPDMREAVAARQHEGRRPSTRDGARRPAQGSPVRRRPRQHAPGVCPPERTAADEDVGAPAMV